MCIFPQDICSEEILARFCDSSWVMDTLNMFMPVFGPWPHYFKVTTKKNFQIGFSLCLTLQDKMKQCHSDFGAFSSCFFRPFLKIVNSSLPCKWVDCVTFVTSSYPGWIKSPHVVTLGILKLSGGGRVFRSKLWSSQIWSFPKLGGGVFRKKLENLDQKLLCSQKPACASQ